MSEPSALTRRKLLSGDLSPAAEAHICSLVVHCRPEQVSSVSAAIAAMPGAELHHAENGKLIVTLETRSDQEVMDGLTGISFLPGVLSAALVYHHVEAETV